MTRSPHPPNGLAQPSYRPVETGTHDVRVAMPDPLGSDVGPASFSYSPAHLTDAHFLPCVHPGRGGDDTPAAPVFFSEFGTGFAPLASALRHAAEG